MKFRKKPVVVEAMQYTDMESVVLITEWLGGDTIKLVFRGDMDNAQLIIPTLEGDMRAKIGDWIIKGVAGEAYPCKPDIFANTYEAVIEDAKEQDIPEHLDVRCSYVDGVNQRSCEGQVFYKYMDEDATVYACVDHFSALIPETSD